MIDAFIQLCNSGEIWGVILKVLLSVILSGLVTLIGTIIAKIVSKHKESKIYKYAKTLVEAAEIKYPNEGTKMGPQKLDYVMSQLCIRFPHIKDNRYLYNIVEQAVFKFNDEQQQKNLIAEFDAKYGDGAYEIIQRVLENPTACCIEEISVPVNNTDDIVVVDNNNKKINTTNTTSTTDTTTSGKLKSF